jgi:hypothetical protein
MDISLCPPAESIRAASSFRTRRSPTTPPHTRATRQPRPSKRRKSPDPATHPSPEHTPASPGRHALEVSSGARLL